jgi:hypothetical protein
MVANALTQRFSLGVGLSTLRGGIWGIDGHGF